MQPGGRVGRRGAPLPDGVRAPSQPVLVSAPATGVVLSANVGQAGQPAVGRFGEQGSARPRSRRPEGPAGSGALRVGRRRSRPSGRHAPPVPGAQRGDQAVEFVVLAA